MKLKCPYCQHELKQSDINAICVNHHTFDRAKGGYFNLHTNHSNKVSGDTPQSLIARRNFLSLGFYETLQQKLTELLQVEYKKQEIKTVLDTGCGEGYYTVALANTLKQLDAQSKISGTDISKFAIKKAAKLDQNIQWLVSSSNELPFFNESFDVIYSIFSPVFEKEFRRLLKPAGKLIVVKPASNHLYEFRSLLFNDLPTSIKAEENSYHGFKITDRIELENKINLKQPAIDYLLEMTPYGWKANEKQHQKIRQLEQLNITINFNITVYQAT